MATICQANCPYYFIKSLGESNQVCMPNHFLFFYLYKEKGHIAKTRSYFILTSSLFYLHFFILFHTTRVRISTACTIHEILILTNPTLLLVKLKNLELSVPFEHRYCFKLKYCSQNEAMSDKAVGVTVSTERPQTAWNSSGKRQACLGYE